MKISKLAVFFAVILPFYLTASEPSAFGAGDLNSPTPYGLTPTEAKILETKKDLHNVVVKTKNQDNKVDSLRERIDGLQTIIESLTTSTHNNKLKLKSLEEEGGVQYKNLNEYDQRLTQSVEKINVVLAEISKLIDSINASYVTKDEFNALVSNVNDFKDALSKELKGSSKSKKSSSESLSKADIETKAKELFSKKQYSKSIEYYKQLIKENYKPARSHYMAGEAEYYSKNYADAIAYFKKSASLYAKAEYMPTLLLHTAISMASTGDKKNAAVFFDAVISKYPDTKEAKMAKERLDSLK